LQVAPLQVGGREMVKQASPAAVVMAIVMLVVVLFVIYMLLMLLSRPTGNVRIQNQDSNPRVMILPLPADYETALNVAWFDSGAIGLAYKTKTGGVSVVYYTYRQVLPSSTGSNLWQPTLPSQTGQPGSF